MIRVAHCLHHFAFDVLLAGRAFCAEALLIVNGAIVRAVLGEETAGGQRFLTCRALEARFVEVFVGDAQHFA